MSVTTELIVWVTGIPIISVLVGAVWRRIPDEFSLAVYAGILFWPFAVPIVVALGVGYGCVRLGMKTTRPREPKNDGRRFEKNSDHPFLVNGNRVDVALCAAATNSYRKGVRIHVTGLIVDEHTRIVQDERTVVVIEEQ